MARSMTTGTPTRGTVGRCSDIVRLARVASISVVPRPARAKVVRRVKGVGDAVVDAALGTEKFAAGAAASRVAGTLRR